MSGKRIIDLTLRDLRNVCTNRGISAKGTKSDLILKLSENIRETGEHPENVRFITAMSETNDTEGRDDNVKIPDNIIYLICISDDVVYK